MGKKGKKGKRVERVVQIVAPLQSLREAASVPGAWVQPPASKATSAPVATVAASSSSVARRRLWRVVREDRRPCEFGYQHNVTVWASKDVTDTGQTYAFWNGYEVVQCRIYVDRQGREYRERVAIDFANNVSFHRVWDGKKFWPRLIGGPIHMDVLGRLLTMDGGEVKVKGQ